MRASVRLRERYSDGLEAVVSLGVSEGDWSWAEISGSAVEKSLGDMVGEGGGDEVVVVV